MIAGNSTRLTRTTKDVTPTPLEAAVAWIAYVGILLYTISSNKVQMNNISDFSEPGSVSLA